MLDEGVVLGRTYQILREIGSGGTGVIYLAYHLRLEKYVVVKKIRDNFVGTINTRAEADILKQLRHTYLPQVYDFLQFGSDVYTVIDYIEGYDLLYYQKTGYQFGEEQLVLWLKQLSEVLEYLHGQKPPILHSDIKPANIMITPQGNVCLIDFNISLEEDGGESLWGLSPWFAAPEQREKAEMVKKGQHGSGIRLDGRMDIYSLGATFYSLMTGTYPAQERQNYVPLAAYHLPYSSGLITIITKAMRFERHRRYQTVTAMKKSLQSIGRSDARYRSLRRQCTTLCLCYGFVMICGGLLTVYGDGRIKQENFDRDYRELVRRSGRMEDQEVISQGTQMLNNRGYGHIWEDGEEKAEVLFLVGNSYYNLENYEAAGKYFRYAVEENPENVIYYRDGAIASARAGDTGEAELLLEQAQERGFEDSQIGLIRANLAAEQQDWETVITVADEVLNSAPDDSGRSRAALLLAKAYESRGDQKLQAEMLKRAYECSGDNRVLRELGNAYLSLAGLAEGKDREDYLNRAGECYEDLTARITPSCQDLLNQAVIREMQGDYEQSFSDLKKMAEEYPDKYEIYMYLAYVGYRIEQGKTEREQSYIQVKEYFTKARYYYEREGQPKDPQMQQLTDLMQDL